MTPENGLTIPDVCEILLQSGADEEVVGAIIFYAAPANLEENEVPASDTSARGLLYILDALVCDGELSISCSKAGYLCAVWNYPDGASIKIWCPDENTMVYEALAAGGG